MKKGLLLITLTILSFLVFACQKKVRQGDLLSDEEANDYIEEIKNTDLIGVDKIMHLSLKTEGDFMISVKNSSDIPEANSSFDFDLQMQMDLNTYVTKTQNASNARAHTGIGANFRLNTRTAAGGINEENSLDIQTAGNFYIENRRMFVDGMLIYKENGEEGLFQTKNELEETLTDEKWYDFLNNDIEGFPYEIDFENLLASYATIEVYLNEGKYQIYLSYDETSIPGLFETILNESNTSVDAVIENIKNFDFTYYLEIVDNKIVLANAKFTIRVDANFSVDTTDNKVDSIFEIYFNYNLVLEIVESMPEFPDFSEYIKGNPELPILN